MRYIQKIDEFLGLFKKKEKEKKEVEDVEQVETQPDPKEHIIEELKKLYLVPGSYRINDDLTVDVFRSLNLFGNRYKKLPFKFGVINGDFECKSIGLETLEGCPSRVEGNFDCSCNRFPDATSGNLVGLKNLVGGPIYVGGNYECSYCELESLEGSPEEIYGSFNIAYNNLKSLDGCPIEISGDLKCEYNDLTKLDTISNVEGNIYCFKNKMDTNDTGFMGWCGGKIVTELK